MSFINWKFVNNKKLPTDRNGRVVSAFDPTHHMSDFDTAAKTGNVAMVLGDTSPYFFIDIDNCRSGDTWSPLATDLCSRFTGCFIEVSQSGRGLHIIGTGTVPDELSPKQRMTTDLLPCTCGLTKCTCRAFDIYRRKRFVALTLTGATGDMAHNAQSTINTLISEYGLTKLTAAAATPDAALRDTPVPEYTGTWPLADIPNVIIAKEQSQPNKAFGIRATFKQLWDGDITALTTFYPSDRDDNALDHSAADLALCTTLCFWCGNNHSAVDELFRQSGLMRDKWEQRSDYRSSTLLRATCRNVYTHVRTVTDDITPLPIGVPFLTIDQMTERFKDYAYVAEINRVFDPTSGLFLDQSRFNAVYGGYIYCMDVSNQTTASTAWNIITKCQVPVITTANTLGFKPMLEPGVHNGVLNTYVPRKTPIRDGDIAPFLKHLSILLPDSTDRAILLNYMAAIIQHKGKKFQWAIVLQGVEGNGKSWLSRVLMECIGREYSGTITGKSFTSNFNEFIANKIFLGVEEFKGSDKFDMLESLKPVITNEEIYINPKGVAGYWYDNCVNLIFNMNEKDGIRKSVTDRRYCIMYTAQQSQDDLQPMKYYQDLWDWSRNGGFAIINNYLSTFSIDSEHNPATTVTRAPRSSAHNEVIYESLTNNETAIMEALDDELLGFRGGIISSQKVKELTGMNGKRTARLLISLGFKKWCRFSRSLLQENGTKPYLWIKKNIHTDMDKVRETYFSLNYGSPQGF